MILHRSIRAAWLLFPALASFGAITLPADARAAPAGGALAPFVGRWQIDTAISPGRTGSEASKPAGNSTYTFVFSPEGSGLKMEVYADYPQAAPPRIMPLSTDGKVHPCPGPSPCLSTGGAVADQSYAWHRIDDHVLARVFYVKGAVFEYSTLSASADGQLLTLISWQPATPQYQNIRSFRKQP